MPQSPFTAILLVSAAIVYGDNSIVAIALLVASAAIEALIASDNV